MKHDQVQTLNYSAHAIEDIRQLEAMMRDSAPETAQVYRRLIFMLQQSVKFILPNCCNLIDPNEMRQTHLDLTRLPFPCVAFEMPWETDEIPEMFGDFKQTAATKRIALCWESGSKYEPLPGLNSLNCVRHAAPEGGVFVLPIYWARENGRWLVAFGGTFIPYENTLQDANMANESFAVTRIVNAAALEAGLAKPTGKKFFAEPFYIQPEIFRGMRAHHGGDLDKTYAQIMLDSRDETLVVIQACSVINCANVTTVEIDAPVVLNKKRQEKGKQPFFSYKVLQLSDDAKEVVRKSGAGTHASPRTHLRRGHVRRLENKRVWVRPSLINAGSKTGTVHKDYAVSSKG